MIRAAFHARRLHLEQFREPNLRRYFYKRVSCDFYQLNVRYSIAQSCVTRPPRVFYFFSKFIYAYQSFRTPNTTTCEPALTMPSNNASHSRRKAPTSSGSGASLNPSSDTPRVEDRRSRKAEVRAPCKATDGDASSPQSLLWLLSWSSSSFLLSWSLRWSLLRSLLWPLPPGPREAGLTLAYQLSTVDAH